MPLQLGVANCDSCGAQVGTVFDENAAPQVNSRGKKVRAVADRVDYFEKVEDAKERANNSVIMGLASFFCPGLGAIMSVTGIIFGILALKQLKAAGVEEGRGQATAGLIIGVLAIIAQVGYVVYAVKSGKLDIE
jgi:hypothetical protein